MRYFAIAPNPTDGAVMGPALVLETALSDRDVKAIFEWQEACRRAVLDDAIRAVHDAGGDNEDYHAAAIAAVRDRQ